jgi:N-acetylglucosaminyldiphosphoundecaprenol N-acetyl-beta-D-mannosaminyltransferase
MANAAARPNGDANGRAPASSFKLRQRVRIGRAWIDALTFDEAIDEIERLIESQVGGSVFTPNVDHLVQLERNPSFRAAYEGASLCLVDGQPLIWASHLLGSPLPQKISGSDLMIPLVRRAERKRWRIYLIGGAPGVAAQAAEKMKEQFDVEIVGTEAPHVTPSGNAAEGQAVIDRIAAAKPHLVFVAFGAPKQELFIQNALASIRPAVAVGVGAGFDFVAGRMKRAPRWISQSGLEWLFRLAQEPRRLARRYLVDDPQFVAILYRTMRDPKEARIKPA